MDIDSFINAIDNKNVELIKHLVTTNNENNSNDNDILLEIYNEIELTTDRLKFIFEKCSKYLEISSALVRQLMKDKNANLLDIIFFILIFLITNLLLNYFHIIRIKFRYRP